MKALVTGGTGFIGYHLIQELIERSWQVKCLVRKTSVIPDEFLGQVEFNTGDLTHRASLGEINNVDVVFHLAGAIKAGSLEGFKRVNTEGTRNLVKAVSSGSNSPKLVFVSSMAAGGPSQSRKPLSENTEPKPVSNYGKSKLLAEQVVEDSDLNYVIIRPAAVYGPGDRETLSFFRLASNHINPKIGIKRRYLSLIHVNDLIDLILKAALSEKSNQIYNAADGTAGYAWSHIINTAADQLDSWTIPLFVPRFLVGFAAYTMTLWSKITGQNLIFNADKFSEMKQRYWLVSSEKAESELGFVPQYDLQAGFDETAQWYREQGWL